MRRRESARWRCESHRELTHEIAVAEKRSGGAVQRTLSAVNIVASIDRPISIWCAVSIKYKKYNAHNICAAQY